MLYGHKIKVLDDENLKYGLKGWWAKLEAFNYGPCLYIDLDSFVMGDISPLMTEPEEFMMCTEWLGSKKGIGGQSSVMLIPRDNNIFEKFYSDRDRIINEFQGDQDWLETQQWSSITTHFPGMVGSYKVHNKDKPVNKIITFHGRPKPHEAQGWAGEKWRRLTG